MTPKTPGATPPAWQLARVIHRREEATGTAALVLKFDAPMEFIPGQYVNLRLPVEGFPRPVQRSYSIGSSPYPVSDELEVIITELPSGIISPLLVKKIDVGDTIEARGPYGQFIWDEDTGAPVLMIAAGSGVVPFLSVMQYMANKNLTLPTTLVVSAQSHEHLIGKDVYDGLAAHDWCHVLRTYTRTPDDDRAQYNRRIDKDILADAGATDAAVIYICGPTVMIDKAKEDLAALGVDLDRIRIEAYP